MQRSFMRIAAENMLHKRKKKPQINVLLHVVYEHVASQGRVFYCGYEETQPLGFINFTFITLC